MKKLTKEEFVERADKVHNYKYNYDSFEFINSKYVSYIKCEEHGFFKKSMYFHINKRQGCPLCVKKELNNYDHNLVIDNNFSYMIGLFQTDGTMSKFERNRGKFLLSLSVKDSDIIYKIKDIIPYNYKISNRIKHTKFKRDNKIYEYHNEIITYCVMNQFFRNFLFENGIPYGKKSKIINIPKSEKLSKYDYIRGLVDGDGSLGFTKKGFPYIGFVTESDDMKFFIIDFISEITGKDRKVNNRNKRDNIYNIVIYKEDAIRFCELVYYENCLSINRKYETARNIINWKRPIEMENRNY